MLLFNVLPTNHGQRHITNYYRAKGSAKLPHTANIDKCLLCGDFSDSATHLYGGECEAVATSITRINFSAAQSPEIKHSWAAATLSDSFPLPTLTVKTRLCFNYAVWKARNTALTFKSNSRPTDVANNIFNIIAAWKTLAHTFLSKHAISRFFPEPPD